MKLKIFTYIILFLAQIALCSKQYYYHPHLKHKKTRAYTWSGNIQLVMLSECTSL